ncbi:MAG: hypothetical protein R3E54_14360 [Halioglobus sp.]
MTSNRSSNFTLSWHRLVKLFGRNEIKATLGELVTQQQNLLKRLDTIDKKLEQISSVSKGAQLLLSAHYRGLAEKNHALPFSEVEFRNYSQFGEDGILHYLFSVIGTVNKRCIEMCAGIGSECNSANLILNHGWQGLLIDGNRQHVEQGLAFFGSHPDSKVLPPRYLHRWITRDNVNSLLEDANFSGEIDLLSIDMDGVDYWIWEAITAVDPRVVVVEFMAHFGDAPVTVPYRDDFAAQWVPLTHPAEKAAAAKNGSLPDNLSSFSQWTMYGGASLAAFNKLARRKGYRLVGANSVGNNAFFIRNGIAEALFPEVPESACYNALFHHKILGTADCLNGLEVQSV